MYTTSTAFLEALQEAGVSYIFANFGSDHPAIIESLTDASLKNKELPKVIISPHEFVAMSAAHGYAQATGEPQAVLVHVECGTQNLGGAIHNAFKAKVPVLVFAGASPFTQEGEMLGSRNEFIHWYQDVNDQRGIMRGYSKYDNEIRTGKNVKQLVHRALQIAKSEPQGPVYLMGPRETMEAETERVEIDPTLWQPISASALPEEEVEALVADLLAAKKPIVVTSYLGKKEEAVQELVDLCERLAIPVMESVPQTMNFPANHPMHCGYQWNENKQHPILEDADFILAIDSDVPWIPTKNKPPKDAIIYYIDADPLKEEMPLWYIPSKRFFRADSLTALKQINRKLDQSKINESSISSRKYRIKLYHEELKKEASLAAQFREDVITPEYLTACVKEIVDDNTIVLNEAITNYGSVTTYLGGNKPGTYFSSGAGSLGWNGGAAIGAKLAHPDKTVISLTGDGSYLFSVPSVVHTMAEQYNTPFLTIIYNNQGWNAPKHSTLGVHPNGIAKNANQFWTNFNPNSELAKVAEAAGNAYAVKVEDPHLLRDELRAAIDHVKSGRSAVLDVRIPTIQSQG
ncbi:thiamine pyrophosphate-requiring protein [Ureibacillus acetophenoni]|uniref:Acetolactate synthase-1/2/3 large subunit n=1 Tax=Ureibacillus acetophenoni TaxID=614649 RepID=A0A285UIZ6_9BACL|nr:thiamine pyrophosphate-requiring protein [Ureibacillus acetophenoni]SOC40221.1 acetolactate synthase-1/2/3 large subunit [Ureibacillus acetophenoni]